MDETKKCPACTDGQAICTEGVLDQSGQTYLPTKKWTCQHCGCSEWEPARTVQCVPYPTKKAA